MKKTGTILIGVVIWFALISFPAWAETTIDDISFGKLLLGEPLIHEDLKDRVVIIAFAKIDCIDFRETVPRLIKWYEKFSPQKLVMMAIHGQISPHKSGLILEIKSDQLASTAEVNAFFKSAKVKFPVFQNGGVGGDEILGVHYCIFNHQGNLIYNDDVLPSDKKLEEIMENTPDPLIGEGSYQKLKAVVSRISQRKELGKIMKQLRQIVKDSVDEIERSEAEALLKRLTRHGQHLKAKAEFFENKEPRHCYNYYRQLVQEFKGCEIGTTAQEVMNALKKDKKFQTSLKAEKDLFCLKAVSERFKPCRSNKPLNIKNCEDCRKKNQAELQKITIMAKRLLKQYPETPAAQKAKDFLSELGIGVD